jgi:hypothetical protein
LADIVLLGGCIIAKTADVVDPDFFVFSLISRYHVVVRQRVEKLESLISCLLRHNLVFGTVRIVWRDVSKCV